MMTILGALAGWYISVRVCMPQSVGGGVTNYPCGQITQLAGPFSPQTAIGAGLGALLGYMVSKK
jgi:hypothetical protein